MVIVSVIYLIFVSSVLQLHLDMYPKAPYDVVYRKEDSLLAVTCTDGYVLI
jgi:hypothetical protein